MGSMITGNQPKPGRQRRNKDTLTPGMEIAYDGVRRGPDLPEGNWCERTLIWWETWRMSPQAQLMAETDWESMFEAALIHNEIWSNIGFLKATELAALTKQLHSILQMYGMSYGDRLKLRIKLVDDIPEQSGTPGEVPNNVIDFYRDRLIG